MADPGPPGDGLPAPAKAPSVALRVATDADLPLLFAVYSSSRRSNPAEAALTEEEQAAALVSQFEAEHRSFQDDHEDAEFLIVEVGSVPAGRLYVLHLPDEIRLLDVALLPDARGAGVGTLLLRSLIAHSESVGIPLTGRLERDHPALAWLERLDFRVAETSGRTLHIERRPEQAALSE